MKNGTDLRSLQEIPDHEDITATQFRLQVATGANGMGVSSPLDAAGI